MAVLVPAPGPDVEGVDGAQQQAQAGHGPGGVVAVQHRPGQRAGLRQRGNLGDEQDAVAAVAAGHGAAVGREQQRRNLAGERRQPQQ